VARQLSLIVIPTYNEVDNVEQLAREICAQPIKVDLLFIDDNSPDGTGQILDRLSKSNSRIQVLHRGEKSGIGSAHLAGIQWAYESGYRCLITMDSDFSHSPDLISRFLEQAQTSDVTVGSRFKCTNSLIEWNVFRKVLTHLGHYLTKKLLGMPYDATGGFRAYRLDSIPREIFSEIQSKGYSFFYESLYVLSQRGVTIKEIPIRLPSRTYGHSKMRLMDIVHGLVFLVLFTLRRRLIPKLFKKSKRIASSRGEITKPK